MLRNFVDNVRAVPADDTSNYGWTNTVQITQTTCTFVTLHSNICLLQIHFLLLLSGMRFTAIINAPSK